MTTSRINRRTATVLTAALALGAAGPAAAQPIGNHGPVPVAPSMHVAYHGKATVLPPFVPRHVKGFEEATSAPVPTVTPRAVATHPGAGDSSDLVYVVVGGVLVALGGLGGTLAVANRRRTAPARAHIAA
jgi:hypothetical protein